jgi:L-ascorbate metabolism protein UlaG (beta-lactamase superfamily)
MKIIPIIIGAVVILIVGFFAFNNFIYNQKQGDSTGTNNSETSLKGDSVNVTAISHATIVLDFAGQIIYNDPTGGAEAFSGQPEPDIILVTDIHGDHLEPETLQAVSTENTKVIVPQAVADLLPKTIAGEWIILNNGETTEQNGLKIEAVPMYNMPESADSRHTKGRGNGYILEGAGKRVYIAGDTDDTPEMRALQNIDMAFVPMNPPFTMDVETAADAVIEFKPKTVYPYHYRGQDGLSDVNKFKELVNQGNSNINVVLLDFYPEE